MQVRSAAPSKAGGLFGVKNETHPIGPGGYQEPGSRYPHPGARIQQQQAGAGQVRIHKQDTRRCRISQTTEHHFLPLKMEVMELTNAEFPGWKWCKASDGREGWVPVELLSNEGADATVL